jgi:hypothetical protein
MQKWFSGSAFAVARGARRCSGFAPTAIEGSVTAVRLAARKPGDSNAVLRTVVISGASKAGSIIETGNVPTANGDAGLA